VKPEDRHLAAPRRVTLRDGRLITLRLLEASDDQAVVDFYAAFRPEDGVYYLPPSSRTREAALKRAARADSPYEVCLVLADDAGAIHGEAWYQWSEKRNQSLFGIGIGPDMQGVGAGRLIMTRLMEIGDVYGPPVMDLTVQIENERAWKLYSSLGFVLIRYQMRGAREDSPPLPEFYMERQMGRRPADASAGVAPTVQGAGNACGLGAERVKVPAGIVADSAPSRKKMGQSDIGDVARRVYWSAMMDEADAFMRGIMTYSVEECGEPLVALEEAVRAAGVEVFFSGLPHAGGAPRLYFLRRGLVPSFLAAAADMNARGWSIRVEDGYRTVAMQRALVLQDQLFAALLRQVTWEVRGERPPTGLLSRRIGALIANAPKVGTHMSGSAVDISVVMRGGGVEVDRGGPYLDMSERTPMESPFVSAQARQNRRDITAIMRSHGFATYPWEFWHYNAGDAYAESLNRTGRPARYGAVHLDPSSGRVTPVDQPTVPLVAPETLRAMMERAVATAAKQA
jgi:D-alanyl-D-alanine dipeptidase